MIKYIILFLLVVLTTKAQNVDSLAREIETRFNVSVNQYREELNVPRVKEDSLLKELTKSNVERISLDTEQLFRKYLCLRRSLPFCQLIKIYQ